MIDQEVSRICKPIDASFGNLIIFSKDIIDGSLKNKSNLSRVSIDFRIAPSNNNLGNKPLSNFY